MEGKKNGGQDVDMKKLTALLVNDFCAAETTAMPATKTGAPKRAAGQRPLQAAPSKEADKSKAELEKRLKDA
jgi:hypothetical protein